VANSNPALKWARTGIRLLGAASAFATYTIEGLPQISPRARTWWLKVNRFHNYGPYRTEAEARAAAEIHDVGLAQKKEDEVAE